MNWKENKKKYPKSCYLLEKYLGGHKKDDYSSHEFEYIINGLNYKDEYFEPQTLGLRSLYDFFDEQEIHIQITVKCAMDNSVWYLAYIWAGQVDEHLPDKDTRPKAEQAAFLKAFEILEEKQL